MAFSIYWQHLIGISCVSSLTFIAIHVCLFPTLLKLSCFKDDYIMFYKGCFGPYWIIIPNVFPLWSHCSILVWLFMLDSICFLSIHLTWSLCLDQIAIPFLCLNFNFNTYMERLSSQRSSDGACQATWLTIFSERHKVIFF